MDVRNLYNSTSQTDRSADFSRIRLNVEQNLINTEDKVSIGGNAQDLNLMPSRLPNPKNTGNTENTKEAEAKPETGTSLKDFMHSKGMKVAMLGVLACSTLVGTLSTIGSCASIDPSPKPTQIVQTLNENDMQELNHSILNFQPSNDLLSKFTFDYLTDTQQTKVEIPMMMAHNDTTTEAAAPVNEKTPEEIRSEVLSPKAARYDKIVEEAAEKYGVDADFIRSIIQQESQFNYKARSKVGAAGMMQLMPRTAKSLGVKNRLDPRDNIMGGVKYIKQLLDKYNGNKELALAAYNAGPTAVSKYGKVPPFKETQKYVSNIMETYELLAEI